MPANSEHMCRIFAAFPCSPGDRWMTSIEAAAVAGVARRTAREHCRALVESGVLEMQAMHGGFRYRRVAKPSKAACRVIRRIERNAEALQKGKAR